MAAREPEERGFLSRWSQRKLQLRQGGVVADEDVTESPATPAVPVRSTAAATAALTEPAQASAETESTSGAPGVAEVDAAARPAPPTLDDVAALTPQADFARFVGADVDPQVRNAALKKLFTDPHYNVMDGLDIYIDDYGKPDPLPAGMLRKMAQSQFLSLFKDDADTAPDPAEPPLADAPASAAPPTDAPAPGLEAPARDEDPDLRLQPDDAAGPAGPEPGPEQDAGRQR